MNSKIFKATPDLTYNESFLIEKINEYPHKFLNLNIVDFSKEFFTTKSTLFRLVKKMNFDSVLDMKLYVQQELAKKGLYQLEFESTVNSRLNNLKTYNTYAIINTIENLDVKMFVRVCKLISKSRKILLFGIGSSFLACHELAINLQKININAFASDEIHETILKISSFNDNDLIIIFSKSSKNKEILFLLEQMLDLKLKSVLITANQEINKGFTYKILLKNLEKNCRIIATCSKTSELVIADAILHEIYFMNKNNDLVLNKSLALLDKWKKYKI